MDVAKVRPTFGRRGHVGDLRKCSRHNSRSNVYPFQVPRLDVTGFDFWTGVAAQATDFIGGVRLADSLPGGVFIVFSPATCLISAWSHDRPGTGGDVIAVGMAPRVEVIDHCLPDLAGFDLSLFLVAPPGLLAVMVAVVDNGLFVFVNDMVSGVTEMTMKSVPRNKF